MIEPLNSKWICSSDKGGKTFSHKWVALNNIEVASIFLIILTHQPVRFCDIITNEVKDKAQTWIF